MLCNPWQFLKFGFYDKAKIHAIKKQHMKRAYPMEECCCQIVCFLFYCILCQTVECCCQSHVLLLICFMFNQSFHVKKKRKFCFFFSFYNTQHQCSVCFWEEIKACAAVHKCCYECMQFCAIHNSFASYGGDIICDCCTKKAECQ